MRGEGSGARDSVPTIPSGGRPLSSEFGRHKTVNAEFWPWLEPLSGKGLYTLSSCSLIARQRRERVHAPHDK